MKLRIVPFFLALLLLAGCAANAVTPPPEAEEDGETVFVDETPVVELVELEDEAVALADAPPAASSVRKPAASGAKTQKNSQATIDYSNVADGYVMVKCSSPGGKRLKAQVSAVTTYTYNLQADAWTTFPLSDGNGSYKVTVFENTTGKSYATVLSASFQVQLTDEFAPFLRPNQYVNFENATKTVAKAEELCKGQTDPLKKVENVYDYVVNNMTYDSKKAATVQSGYLPVLDTVLDSKTGICFDYAALMTAMLRSQDVPCKMVVGYAGKAYHAWISVWTKESGWVDGAIFFNGTTWQRMDPTFISSGKGSAAVAKFVGDGNNYTTKYLY